jgi:phosphoesterase RecJ-like protein
VSPTLRSVGQWLVTGTLIEVAAGLIKLSFRSKDGEKYDVSKLTVALGGGGHKAAAGASVTKSLQETKELVVAKAKELYNL